MSLFLEDELISEDPSSRSIENKQEHEESRIPFPYEIKNIDPELNLQLLNDFSGERTGFVQVGPKKWLLPSGYAKAAENIYNFKPRPDDVFVITFPRSGTTWTQEMVWLLCNDLDYQKAAEKSLDERFPFLEFSSFVHKDTKAEFLKENISDHENYKMVQGIDYPAWKTLSEMKERRFVKTHLPFSLLPPNLTKTGCKIIYVARNPKDVAVSLYHFNRSVRTLGYTGNFAKYWFYFQNNLQSWTPYWEHIKEGWNMRNDNNVLFLFYENMNQNLKPYIGKTASFLGKTYSNEELNKLGEHLKFENFRKNKSVNDDALENLGIFLKTEEPFFRKGKNGGWRDYFDQDLEKKANKWIEENLKDTDLRFPI